ncbi:F0F1 ATP synthase subunit A [Anaeromyxobacter paludicola]|uniref:ATP synthase subunit a n=1 Tax=Anaeromyxobacter paludicola TaxID=2918171 RepID=A0ABM7XCV4_9BACT|nr:F0F1 ATP synthase subunit A [Anaeromyxobacter paludicola]BDG09698.1 ATP synthase subunit a 2 [Anaeromyxobacter paludicola]
MNAVIVALALALGQAQEPAAAPAPAEHAAPAAGQAETPAVAPGEHEVAPGQGAHEHGGNVAEPAGHEGAEHEESLSDVLMEHVSDSYVLEFPGFCHGGFSAGCELDLREVFGTALVFHVGGTAVDMTPTKHLIMLWLASALLLLAFFAASRNRELVPRGLYNFLELLVQFVRDEIAMKNIGKADADRFVPYLCTAFFFILFANLFGLIPYAATATGNLAVTLTLAVFTFLITQYAQIKAQGLGGWLKHLTGGVHPALWVIMVPVEILGLFTKPFALTIRLFANMIAGHIVILSLLGLIFALHSPLVALGSVPMALGIFALELFVAFVQAYIFTMLSSLFIGAGLVHHGHDDHGHGEEAHGEVAHAHVSDVAGKAPGHG